MSTFVSPNRQYIKANIVNVNGWVAFTSAPIPFPVNGNSSLSPSGFSLTSPDHLRRNEVEEREEEEIDYEAAAETDDQELDDSDPRCYPGIFMLRPSWDPVPRRRVKKSPARTEDTTINPHKRKATEDERTDRIAVKKLKESDSDTDLTPPPSGASELSGPAYSRETYNEEKDMMIRFLRDDLENTWVDVSKLYDEYWGMNVSARSLRRRYAVVVPKAEQGIKKAGRFTTGDKDKGMRRNGKYWEWMKSWETVGRLK
jgi:hypothetical protein